MKLRLILLCSVLIVISCKQPAPSSVSVSVIMDQTDPHTAKPRRESILKLFGLAKDKRRAVTFRMQGLTDRILNKVTELVLPDMAVTQKENRRYDAHHREKRVLQFYQSVEEAIQENRDTTNHSLPYSECFRTIAGELSYLASSRANERYLIVYSDLQEHSDLCNSYTDSYSKEEIKSLFESAEVLADNLRGVQVYLIYEPGSRQSDRRYMKQANIYKALITERGGSVKIQASL